MITLRFVTTTGLVSWGIRKFEYGYWASHVEALMPDGTLLGAHAKGGVLARPHGYDDKTMKREEYVSIPATPAEMDAFYTFLRDQLDKPYDFKAILGLVAQRNWRDPARWFCSELQAAALCKIGVFPGHLADTYNRITPRDLMLIVSGRVLLPDA